jgi:uncharacterized iron-regulated membrane protein
MKRRLFFLHSWLGLLAGLGLVVIGLTGSVLVFKDEIDAAWSPQMVVVAPEPAGRLPYDQRLLEAKQALPGHLVTGWVIATKPEKADQLWVVAEGTSDWRFVHQNPYNGQILNDPANSRGTLTGWLLELHYTFFADHAGLLIAGALAFLLCLLGITGVWLYRGFWKTFFTLRWDRSARIFFSDAHKMVGISSVAFNLILGFTGAWWNLSHLVGHLFEEEHEEDPAITRTFYADTLSLDKLLAEGATKLPGYQAGYISLPTSAEADIMTWGAMADSGILRGPYGSNVSFDAQTGAVKETRDIRAAGVWDQFLDTFTPLHYGTFGGLPVKILWCVGGLTPGILGVTGFLMWYRRKYPKRSKRMRMGNSVSDKEAEVEALTTSEP